MLKHESNKQADRKRNEVLERVAAAYPYMFRSVKGRSADFFRLNPGIANGWLGIFERLCLAIDKELTPNQKKRFRLWQVKAKFGALRVYWEIGSKPCLWADIQVPDGRVITLRPRTRKRSIAERVERVIAEAVAEAANTCEVCGAQPAMLRVDEGWLTTLCDSHAQELEVNQQ